MGKLSSYNILCVVIFLFPALQGFSQSKTEVKAIVDKSRILIGEPILLTLEADIPENEAIRFFNLDTIPHFEILQKQKTDTSDTNEGTTLRQIIRITSFDSGHWVIPSFILADGVVTDTIPVDVVFSEFDPEQDYHDIKDIIEVSPTKKKTKWWLWYAIAGGVLAVAAILYFIFRKKKAPAQVPVIEIAPYDEAMQSLQKLKELNFEQKQYYSKLVDIFRIYVYKKKEIHSLQKTTNDLVIQLKSLSIDKEVFEQLSKTLRLSDYVKFAKYIPDAGTDKESFDIVKNAITEIEQLN